MNEFICDKTKVREILDFHELKCSNQEAYRKISGFLDTLPDTFTYNSFCGKLGDFIRVKMDSDGYEEARFKNALIERMRRYKLDVDWKDLNSKLPKMTRAKRTRIERRKKVEKINKNREDEQLD
jgi:hypothetical protein